ncbi:hypothetical protein SEA_JOURNEY13_64 [Mycobacterium phage Journey13]|nr:hypothetical protein SEA_JOURNEY13_64 [Mycobacterium phage Journey13]
MLLTHIVKNFPEIVHSDPEVVSYRPGWLFAQKCEAWWIGDPEADPVSVMLIYRSPRVKDASRIYRPVADLILSANKVEFIAKGRRREDPDLMVHGDRGCEYIVARMTQADEFPGGPLNMKEVRTMIDAAVEGALSNSLAAV